MKPNKHNLDIEVIIPMLIEGKTYRAIAEHLQVPLATLHDFCSRNDSQEGISSNIIRVRQALDMSAQSYADKAIDVLTNAEGTFQEINRASHLAKVFLWMASKRSPKTFGNNSEVDITKTTKIIKVKSASTDVDDKGQNEG